MKQHIALVTGGDNKEREVSLQSAQTFIKHISPEHYDMTIFTFPEQEDFFKNTIQNFAIVIPVIHGVGGEDGVISHICKDNGVPYFFTTPQSHMLCIDKEKSNKHVSKAGFSVPISYIIKKGDALPHKVFIKPVHGGSSVDCGVFESLDDNNGLIERILIYDDALIQDHVHGREFTVSIVGNYDENPRILAISEIITGQAFFDYEAKYQLKNTNEITPAIVDSILEKKIQDISLGIYKACNIIGLGRIDFIYTPETDTLYFLEVNTIPGFTENSFFPQAIIHSGQTIAGFLHQEIQKLITPGISLPHGRIGEVSQKIGKDK